MVMYRRNYIFLTLVFLILQYSLLSNEVQWASKVIGFSSEFSKSLYSARQILEKPNVLPAYGQTPCAWSPKNEPGENRIEWIHVGFDNPIYVKQIAISENYYSGNTSRVFLYDSLGTEYLVYNNEETANFRERGRLLKIFISKTSFRVFSLKLVVNVNNITNGMQIDAIGVSDTTTEISIVINSHKSVNSRFIPENPGNNINSEYHEIAPVISPDGRIIYFTRDDHPDNFGVENKQDIWFSELDSTGKFQKAKNLGLPINNESNNFIFSITPDGNSMLVGNVYDSSGSMRKGISICFSEGTEWGFPQEVKIDDFYNLNSLTGGCCLSNNRKVLLMSVERKDSYGGLDLYASFLKNDGTWTVPRNLGPDINTGTNEDSPFLASDGVSLYFSTAGHPGYGSNDMFLSRRLDDTWTKWSEPENLGADLNTSGWDAFYTIPASGEYAYFVSDQNTLGKDDIFRVQLPEELRPKPVALVYGKVYNAKTKQPLGVSIKYEILPDGIEAGIARSNSLSGDYKIVLPTGSKYGFLAELNGFISVNEFVDLRQVNKYQEIHKDLYLVPIEIGQTARINNIFFDFDKYDLLEDSFSELNRLVELLNKYPKISIMVAGHTDSLGTKEYNLVLSRKRAESVVKYLVSQKISKSRLKSAGFGFSKPIDTNTTDEGRQKNRRVEFTILEY